MDIHLLLLFADTWEVGEELIGKEEQGKVSSGNQVALTQLTAQPATGQERKKANGRKFSHSWEIMVRKSQDHCPWGQETMMTAPSMWKAREEKNWSKNNEAAWNKPRTQTMILQSSLGISWYLTGKWLTSYGFNLISSRNLFPQKHSFWTAYHSSTSKAVINLDKGAPVQARER